jgi:hypothetical protein
LEVECPLSQLGRCGYILDLIVAHEVYFDALAMTLPSAVPFDFDRIRTR